MFYVSAVTSDIWESKAHPPINTELQNHYERSLHAPKIDTVRMNYSKEMENWNLHALLKWMFKGLAPMESSMEDSHEMKRELSYDPATLLLGVNSKAFETGSLRGTCSFMFIVASLTIVKVLWVNVQAKHKENMWYTANEMLLTLTKDR